MWKLKLNFFFIFNELFSENNYLPLLDIVSASSMENCCSLSLSWETDFTTSSKEWLVTVKPSVDSEKDTDDKLYRHKNKNSLLVEKLGNIIHPVCLRRLLLYLLNNQLVNKCKYLEEMNMILCFWKLLQLSVSPPQIIELQLQLLQ